MHQHNTASTVHHQHKSSVKILPSYYCYNLSNLNCPTLLRVILHGSEKTKNYLYVQEKPVFQNNRQFMKIQHICQKIDLQGTNPSYSINKFFLSSAEIKDLEIKQRQ